MRIALFTLVSFLSAACAVFTFSSQSAREKIVKAYQPKIGKATKADFEYDFGTPEWCKKNHTGTERCRYYRSFNRVEEGKGFDYRSYIPFDEVLATFDSNGTLEEFNVISVR